MIPNDLLLLTIPATAAALKFGLIAFAVATLARGSFQPQVKLSPRQIAPSHAPQDSHDSRA